ncbi:MAG: AbrB family transcriptional regulator [Nitrososphaerota archaeon]|nr:AbrB family transcriptional regulator [Nitrososphaerota archaeon]
MEEIEVRRIDDQGRVLLPSSWRKRELGGAKEVIIMTEHGQLKIIPKKKVDLTKFFDKVGLGVGGIEDWRAFESAMDERR